MIYLILKAAITGIVVVAISEISKRSSIVAALLASLPLTSILAFVWMYQDKSETDDIRTLSYGIFWMVIPSLAFFLLFPAFLKIGLKFYPALGISCILTAVLYAGYVQILTKFGIQI